MTIMNNEIKKYLKTILILLIILMSCNNSKNIKVNTSGNYSITLDVNKPVTKFKKSMLLGTNAGVYYDEANLLNLNFINYLRQLNPGIIRIPGGSWSNELYWNGNKVRLSKESYIDSKIWKEKIKNGENPIVVAFDTSRYKNGQWDVDYSGYSPGFCIRDTDHHLSDFHGLTDVLFLHKFIHSFNSQTMVTVNMGTGSPDMAAEWVKWVKNRSEYMLEPFDVKYWEMGNELDGKWELGHYLKDGKRMNAEEYIRRYKIFAKSMKNEDPTIKVGGSVASSMKLAFIEELIKDREAPIDFISFHAYPCSKEDRDLKDMIQKTSEINIAVKKINNWLEEYRPDEKEKIEIAVTEWNIKVKEDITTIDIRNTLWSAAWIGEMIKAGVDIALQWDMFSTKDEGGHGLFNWNEKEKIPRSQYWSLYLWNKFMGDSFIETNFHVPSFVKVFATKNDKFVSLMIINGSEENDFISILKLPFINSKTKGEVIDFSRKQYLLDTNSLVPIRSEKPVIGKLKLNREMKVLLKPYSIKIIRIPLYK